MNKKYTCIIVEDETNELELLEILLAEYGKINVVGVANTVEYSKKIITKKRPDLVLLDIQLYGKSAFEILDYLSLKSVHPKIIFTTAHKDYAIKAIKYAAFDYLLKPIEKNELFNTLDRFIEEKNDDNFVAKYDKLVRFNKFPIYQQSGVSYVYYDEIVYIDTIRGANISAVHLINNKKFISNHGIGDVSDILEKKGFIRLTRSLILNPIHIEAISKLGKIKMTGTSIQVSAKKAKELIRIIEEKI